MKLSSTAIKFRDYMALVVVWELHEGYWQILSVVRLKAAIALAQKSPTTRLIFPTGVFPDGVWGGIYKHRATPNNHQKADFRRSRQERVLALLLATPGQTREAIAFQLGISVATVIQLLRSLEKAGNIHHCPHPMQNKTKLYYVGTAPTNTQRGTALYPNKPPRSTRSVPPLKVYFVDPRTLQSLNR